jgi:hypothetical protein
MSRPGARPERAAGGVEEAQQPQPEADHA